MILRGKYLPVVVLADRTKPAKSNTGLGIVRSAFGAAIVTGVFALATTVQSNSEHCVPGFTQACSCSDGSGSQTCHVDGESFGECVCPGAAATSAPAASGAPPVPAASSLTTVAPPPAREQRIEVPNGPALALYADFGRPSVNAVGEFRTECVLDQGILAMRVRATTRVSSNSYGGCCVEAPTDVDLGGDVQVSMSVSSSNPEPEFHAKLETNDNAVQEFIHKGPMTSGTQRFTGRAEETSRALRRACFVIVGRGSPAHTADVHIEAPTYLPVANRPASTSAGETLSRRHSAL